MADPTVPADLPNWIRDHIRRYQESDGADGHMWDLSVAGGSGLVPTLLLTATGHKSGRERVVPLIYGEHGDAYVIVASKGGFPTNPAWYVNLTAQPEVKVQVAAKRFRARARTATGDERAALWQRMAAIYSPYIEYQKRTEREIPVVVLEPIET